MKSLSELALEKVSESAIASSSNEEERDTASQLSTQTLETTKKDQEPEELTGAAWVAHWLPRRLRPLTGGEIGFCAWVIWMISFWTLKVSENGTDTHLGPLFVGIIVTLVWLPFFLIWVGIFVGQFLIQVIYFWTLAKEQ